MSYTSTKTTTKTTTKPAASKEKKLFIVMDAYEMRDVYGTPETYERALVEAKNFLGNGQHDNEECFILEVKKIVKITTPPVEVRDVREDDF